MCIRDRYYTVQLPKITDKCTRLNKSEALNDLVAARRCRSSLDSAAKSNASLYRSSKRTTTPKVRFVTRKAKMVNNIYAILRQVDDESTYTEIPMRKRRKKWIRSIHDLMCPCVFVCQAGEVMDRCISEYNEITITIIRCLWIN
eukprot:TRINITY_DN2132_c0_g1_i5.p1 TRINITY_DN2132_c0_g1~~TRINITY_DN2132_c0_g1_i5.p1  ORF type:complete len:144 (-),score=12.79 TRINITY_DN2132_c0_g1_i5:821-1252(-)